MYSEVTHLPIMYAMLGEAWSLGLQYYLCPAVSLKHLISLSVFPSESKLNIECKNIAS